MEAESSSECRVGAAGTLESGDRFSGAAEAVGADVRGAWGHASGTAGVLAERLVGRVESLSCEQNGALLIIIQGTGRFDGRDGYAFQVTIQDRQDPALTDTYRIAVVDAAGTLAFAAAGLFASGDVHSLP